MQFEQVLDGICSPFTLKLDESTFSAFLLANTPDVEKVLRMIDFCSMDAKRKKKRNAMLND
jgi:hypothetical protein